MTTIDALNACLADAAKLGTLALMEARNAIPEKYQAALSPEIKRQHQPNALEADYAKKS